MGIEINEFGDVMAQSIVDFFNNGYQTKIINKCIEGGVEFVASPSNEILKGNKFVITGTLVNFKRSEIKNKLELMGATISSSISVKTDYLICGANPGSTKLSKANELNISIIDEQTLIDLIKV